MPQPPHIGNAPLTALEHLVFTQEEWLMARILHYAQRQSYTLYASTLLEAWRTSIVGLNEALKQALAARPEQLELHPDEDFQQDPVASFGILESRRHRTRGIRLEMFLGMMKYYRQSYQDLVTEKVAQTDLRERYRIYLERFFDRIELGFCGEWASCDEIDKLAELLATNRRMTNERNLYLTIFESLLSPVFLLGPAGKIVHLNHRARELFSPLSRPGTGYYSSLEPIEIPWLTELFQALGSKEIHEDEHSITTNQGPFQFKISLKRMLDVSGRANGAVVVLHDISPLRRIEAEQQSLLTELRRSNTELESFAYVASHDLQEPLRMITSYLQLLERRYQDQLDESAHEFIAFAVDGANRMKGLIQDLLNYSRISRIGQNIRPVNLREVLQLVLSRLRLTMEETGAQIDSDPLPTLPGDRTLLTQLLQNLLGNALKFHGDQPPDIRIRVSEETNHWSFSVRDNGIGIAPEQHRRIFQVFTRLHTRSEFPGTGIGLALCKKIVEQHGGEIWVESADNRGSTFYFTLKKESPGSG